jgi:hypothetical protein
MLIKICGRSAIVEARVPAPNGPEDLKMAAEVEDQQGRTGKHFVAERFDLVC